MATELDLSDKTILITGGAGAIGQVIVATLARHGAQVAVNDVLDQAAGDAALRASMLRATMLGATMLGDTDIPDDRVAYFPADAGDADAVARLLDAVTARFGLPDVVCCHAGMVEAFPVDQYPLDRFDQLLHVNLRTAFVMAQAASQRWIADARPGHLIFTTSWVQDVPWPEITPYTASKAGMKAIMRGFARELAPRGIRANAIAPGRRPLSSMTPTLVFRADGTPWIAMGSPGGSRIITTVLQVLLNRLVHGLNLASAVAEPRIHSQLWPDQISLEQGISPDTQRLLQQRGHRLVLVPAMGSANSVEVLPEGRGSVGVADPRRLDAAAVPERP